MSGINPAGSTPVTSIPAGPTPAVNPPGGFATPATAAPAGDSKTIGGGQTASGGIESFKATVVPEDLRKPLPPRPEPVAESHPTLEPFTSKPALDNKTTQQKGPIKKTHFSIVDGPRSPDP
jgi:hypothetical protein